jgi:hypothetical protein
VCAERPDFAQVDGFQILAIMAARQPCDLATDRHAHLAAGSPALLPQDMQAMISSG